MSKILCCLVVACSLLRPVAALDSTTTSGWKYSVLTNMTMTLNNYSGNWAGTDFSTMSWGWQCNATALRALAPWVASNNTLKLAFGQTLLQEEQPAGEKTWQPPKKSSDLVDFETVLRFTLQSYVDPFVSVRTVTQFVDMRVPGHDEYGNPLVITESFGAVRDIFKADPLLWSVRLGGALRQSVEANQVLVAADNSLEKLTNDGGVEFVTDFKTSSKDKRLSYIGQIKAYEALFSSSSDKVIDPARKNFWRYPDIAWENTLAVTLTKYVMLNVYAQMLYDREIVRDLRLRQTVSLGLTYSVAN